METSDKRLWTGWLRSGDEHAFEALVRPHMAFALDFARRMGCKPDQADDVLQTCLARLAAQTDNRPVRVGIRAWLGRSVSLESSARSARKRSSSPRTRSVSSDSATRRLKPRTSPSTSRWAAGVARVDTDNPRGTIPGHGRRDDLLPSARSAGVLLLAGDRRIRATERRNAVRRRVVAALAEPCSAVGASIGRPTRTTMGYSTRLPEGLAGTIVVSPITVSSARRTREA